jgi:hypothetical protein
VGANANCNAATRREQMSDFLESPQRLSMHGKGPARAQADALLPAHPNDALGRRKVDSAVLRANSQHASSNVHQGLPWRQSRDFNGTLNSQHTDDEQNKSVEKH